MDILLYGRAAELQGTFPYSCSSYASTLNTGSEYQLSNTATECGHVGSEYLAIQNP
jgi:hypothetical protein